jgi:hypothetical protein
MSDGVHRVVISLATSRHPSATRTSRFTRRELRRMASRKWLSRAASVEMKSRKRSAREGEAYLCLQ